MTSQPTSQPMTTLKRSFHVTEHADIQDNQEKSAWKTRRIASVELRHLDAFPLNPVIASWGMQANQSLQGIAIAEENTLNVLSAYTLSNLLHLICRQSIVNQAGDVYRRVLPLPSSAQNCRRGYIYLIHRIQ